MTEFKQKAIVSNWPLGKHAGKTVRFFEVIDHFVITQWDNEWRIRDTRKANHRGGPDNGIWFDTEKEAWEHVNLVH